MGTLTQTPPLSVAVLSTPGCWVLWPRLGVGWRGCLLGLQLSLASTVGQMTDWRGAACRLYMCSSWGALGSPQPFVGMMGAEQAFICGELGSSPSLCFLLWGSPGEVLGVLLW